MKERQMKVYFCDKAILEFDSQIINKVSEKTGRNTRL